MSVRCGKRLFPYCRISTPRAMRFIFASPQEQVISQQVFLPLAAQDNLQQVLEYEIERQLPFQTRGHLLRFLSGREKGRKVQCLCLCRAKESRRRSSRLIRIFWHQAERHRDDRHRPGQLSSVHERADSRRRRYDSWPCEGMGNDRRPAQRQPLEADDRIVVLPSLSRRRVGSRRGQRAAAGRPEPSPAVLSVRRSRAAQRRGQRQTRGGCGHDHPWRRALKRL